MSQARKEDNRLNYKITTSDFIISLRMVWHTGTLWHAVSKVSLKSHSLRLLLKMCAKMCQCANVQPRDINTVLSLFGIMLEEEDVAYSCDSVVISITEPVNQLV